MSTSFHENPVNILAPVWETDADLNWSETDKYTATKRKVEGQGDISPYIASTPREAKLDGIVTATTLDPVTLQPQRLVDSKAKIQALAAKRQPVLVINPMFSGWMAITEVTPSKSAADGQKLKVSISLIEIQTTTAAMAQAPAAKLKPKVKKRAATGKKGGAAKGAAPTPRQKTKALTAANALGAFR